MIVDALGRSFEFREPPRRVVSLVPSLTETLFDLGAGEAVVGITDWCIFPPGLTLPRVGGTKNPRIGEIRALAPDLVHVNVEENVRRHAEELEAFTPVFATEPKSVQDVASLIATLGAIHHRGRRAGELNAVLGSELAHARTRPFTFACPIWKDPWMWCGGDTYVSSLVEAAGGTNVLAARLRYPRVEPGDVLALRPEVVFLPDEPFAFSGADRALFPGTSVVGPFPGHLFTWHGTRTIAGLRFLRDAL